ncbi:MAG TPA: ATP-binding protein [Vicinamibacterales bacterium]|nr:ATP-binding protein [Vicinamibacterales bacterium]
MTAADSGPDRRLLFLAGTTKDGATAQAMLSPLGIRVDVCRSFGQLLREMVVGVGALLLPEEIASVRDKTALRRLLAQQPPWSDVPILILTRPGADSEESAEAVRTLGNVTLLERPMRVATLVSTVRTALRARERQYQIREHLERRAASEAALREADQRKDEFLATLGHELRNPLSPLLTATQLLKTSGLNDPVVTRVSTVMERQIRHLVRLVDDLLEVSRITRGLIEIRREPLDLVTVIQTAIESTRPLLDAASHTLSIDLPPERVIVHGDGVRLTQVFINLLTNAAKYTDAGGRIVLRLTRERGVALVSIRDNGIGIPANQLAAVFDMFTQVDRSNRRAQGGLGIGLTLVKSLVAMHDGRIEARSEGPGRGSEFVLQLPTIDAPVAHSAGKPLTPFPHQRILVVDDNTDAAETLGELLARLGATVRVVHSGRAALDAIGPFAPDAVLVDIGMPGMDGYEVARQIRASGGAGRPGSAEGGPGAQPLLIALTGWGQEYDRQRSAAAGFDHHVVKPPDIERLGQLLVAAGAHEHPQPQIR